METVDKRVMARFASALVDHMNQREPGHCLVVRGLVAEYASELASQVHDPDNEDHQVWLVSEDPSQSFELTPFAAVRLRDGAGIGKYVLGLIAPERSSVEDSLGANTFEVLETAAPGSLYRSALSRLQSDLSPDVDEAVEVLFEAIHSTDVASTAWGKLRYLARVGASDEPSVEMGRALPELSLLPDSRVAPGMDLATAQRSITQNVAILEALTRMAPPAERLRSVSPLVPKNWIGPLGVALDDSRETRDPQLLIKSLIALGSIGELDVSDCTETPSLEVDNLRILRFTKDIINQAAGWVVTAKARPSLGVRVRCEPPPRHLMGLKEIVIEVVQETDADAVPTVSSTSIRNRFPTNTDFERSIRTDWDDLEPGHYRFRVKIVDNANVIIAEVDSEETFSVNDEPVPPKRVEVPAIAVAEAMAGSVGGDSEDAVVKAERDSSGLSGRILVEYPDMNTAFEIQYPSLLWRLESMTIEDPQSFGRYAVDVESGEIVAKNAPPGESIPNELALARTALMEAVLAHQRTQVDSPSLVVCDLSRIREPAERFINAWVESVDNAPSIPLRNHLLGVDQVRLDGFSGEQSGCLIGPFHPVRLAWLLTYDQFLSESATQLAGVDMSAVDRWSARMNPDHAPLLAAEQGRGWFRFVETLTHGWALYLSPDTRETERAATSVRTILGLDDSRLASLRSADLQTRIDRYLSIHPYLEQLIVNVIRPGDAHVVLAAIEGVAATQSDLRFVVRMFDDGPRHEIGAAFDDFMSDKSTDRFHTASGSVLYPALTYSKHRLDGLIKDPGSFPAHLTVFLDHFSVRVTPSEDIDRRSVFLGGLIVRPVSRFHAFGPGGEPTWAESVHGDGSLVGAAIGAVNRGLAQGLPGASNGSIPGLELRLDERDQRLLAAVHRKSDWIVVVDPIFSDAYLDRPMTETGDLLYLLDHASDPDRSSARRITVSTRSRGYLKRVLGPIASRVGIDIDDNGADRLLRGLNVLGSGLVLRLLDGSTKAVEAFTLGLAALELGAAGILRHALVIPLDLYPSLFKHGDSGRRADLLLIRPDSVERRLDLAIVEVKARSNLGLNLPSALVEDVTNQLATTWDSLERALFRDGVSSLERAYQVDGLRTVLHNHIDRAARFGILDLDESSQIASFVDSLEDGYSFSLPRLHALVFDLDGGEQGLTELDGDLPVSIWRISRSTLDALIGSDAEDVTTARLGLSGGVDVQAVFKRSETRQLDSPLAPPDVADPEQAADIKSQDAVQTDEDQRERSVSTEDQASEVPESSETPYDGPDESSIAFIGSTATKQFGVVGRLARSNRPVALDTDATSVVSVFGAQGSGKSYSIGTLIEAALMPLPKLGRMHNALSGVVFHYSRDPSYEPEFVSMARPNSDPADVAALDLLGVEPRALEGVTVLTPPNTVEQRREELKECSVEPLLIGTGQLTLDHWRLLMGLEGGTQLYGRELGRILENLRSSVTFESLTKAVDESDLTPAQRDLAKLRLGFVRSFVRDGADVTSHLRRGQLLIIDLRDEYVDKDQALALFMVALDLLTGSRSTVPGNKLVVFDEAHKYIGSGALVERLVTKIREMRHLGTTVVIASQDPPSLPQNVIELSTTLIAHRFTSPQWLSHLKKFSAGFSEHAPQTSAFSRLEPGEAFVYATVGDDVFERPQLVRFRPRVTRHGGETRRATDM